MSNLRCYSLLDKLCMNVDEALRTMCGATQTAMREYPAREISEVDLTAEQRNTSASLMRINHAGEVCAQALYHSQSFFSRNESIRQHMQQAAKEEGDHLAWCQTRLIELGSHTSYLNPMWYAGSFAIGLAAGLMGDRWSLGFVAETENQVVKHLENHFTLLPENDKKSLKILHQMHEDEAKHREDAIQSGASVLPVFIKKLMSLTSKVMVKTAFWI